MGTVNFEIKGPYIIPISTCQCEKSLDAEEDNCCARTPSDDLCYSGPNLPGTGIRTNESLTIALQKIDQQILMLKEQVVSLILMHM